MGLILSPTIRPVPKKFFLLEIEVWRNKMIVLINLSTGLVVSIVLVLILIILVTMGKDGWWSELKKFSTKEKTLGGLFFIIVWVAVSILIGNFNIKP
jgi:hypothetical protein